MKKYIILLTIMFIFIPYIVVINYKEQKKNVKYKSNFLVKLKKENIVLPLEDYIIGVVAAEMPASYEKEALKAQAVAARTYAIKKMRTVGYLYNDTSNQVYLSKEDMKQKWKDNYNDYHNKIKEIVLDTRDEVIKYNDELIDAFFFSTSSGKTANSEDIFQTALPYLKSVDSNWDKTSPTFKEAKYFNLNEFCLNLNIDCNRIDIKKENNMVTINDKDYKITEIRKIFNLKSPFFDITKENKKIKIETYGYGHGVGMSQYGANYMAKEGKNYIQILKYYFKNVEIKKI